MNSRITTLCALTALALTGLALNAAAAGWSKQPSAKRHWTEREHAKQWDQFNEDSSTKTKKAAQDIIDK